MSKFVLTAQLQLQAPTNITQVVNQMQRQLNNVQVNIQAQGSVAAQKQINNVANAANNATTAANRMGKAFAISIKRFAAFSIATRAVGLFTTTLGNAVTEAVDFERQLIKVSQVTGKTMAQLKDLTGEINRLSTGLGVASKSLLEVSRTLAQAGLSARDTKIALDSLAKTTLAPTFDDITQTAEGAVAVMAQFKQGAAALEKQLGAINAVAGQFAVEAGDLISVIRRTGGVFREAGGDLNELIGLFTSVRATTRESADSIATGLRTIFTRIQRPKTIEFLKQFGVSLTDTSGKFVGAYEAIARLSSALKGLEQGDIRFIKIAEQLGGFRQIGKVIPLLKEFKTAEEARQAAIAGGNSLAEDAAKAQQTLAVQITKVQENFARLMRDITETTTFQVMAKSALAFADALIRIADAIKPLLPILAALAAFKLAKTFGQFGAGLASGIKNIGANVQGANNGGRIRHFARGGLVPGTGNRDTVPAMLQPGEFVIKKSSVKSIGAGSLASMNQGGAKKYAKGGQVQLGIEPGAIGGFFLKPDSGQEIMSEATSEFKAIKGAKAQSKLLGTASSFNKNDITQALGLSTKELGALTGADGKPLLAPSKVKSGDRNAKVTLNKLGKLSPGSPQYLAVQAAMANADKRGTLEAPGGGSDIKAQASGPIVSFLPSESEMAGNPTMNQIVNSEVKDKIGLAIQGAVDRVYKGNFSGIGSDFPINQSSVDAAITRAKADNNIRRTTSGFVFEGLIDGMTGAAAGGEYSNFDFPSSSIGSKKDALQKFFGGDSAMQKLVKGDAKRSLTNKSVTSIAGKVANDFSKGITEGISHAKFLNSFGGRSAGHVVKFASGGSVKDTVPAMLTPGEYVLNKRSAQQIGYGNLNSMNKRGVKGFNKGGPVGVQYFQDGGMTTASPAELKSQVSLASDFESLSTAIQNIINAGNDLVKQLDDGTLTQDEYNAATAELTKIHTEANTKRGEMNKAGQADLSSSVANVQADFDATMAGVTAPGTSVVDVAAPVERKLNTVAKTKVQPAPAGAGGVVDTTTADPATMSLTSGAPSPDMAVDMLGPEVNQIVTAIQPLSEVLTQLGMSSQALDTAFDATGQGAFEVTQATAILGDGMVQNNQQINLSMTQVDTGLNDLAVTAGKAATEAKDLADAAGKAADNADKQSKENEKSIEQTKEETKAGMGAMGMFLALQSVLAMLPTEIEETDGALKRIGKNAVKTALSLTALGFLLNQFGISLSVASLVTKTSAMAASLADTAKANTSLVASGALNILSMAANKTSLSLEALSTKSQLALGGLAALALVSYIVMDSFQQMAAEQKKSAIEAGNITKASSAAMAESGYGTAKVLGVLAAAIGALLVVFLGFSAPVTLLVGAIVGVAALLLDAFGFLTPVMNAIQNTLSFFTLGIISSTDAVRLRAEADAAATNASERVKEASESVAEAFKEVSDGASTASDALFENEKSNRAFKSAGDAVNRELKAQAEEAGTDTDDQALKARKEVIGRFVKEKGTEEGVSGFTQMQMDALEIDDSEVSAFKENTQKIFDLIKEEADLRARAAKEMIISGTTRGGAGVTQESFVQEQTQRLKESGAFDALSQEQQQELIEDLNTEYENQLKAVRDNIQQLNRFNFGLTETNGAIAMASARIDNLNMAFDSGAARIRKSINNLSAIIEDGASLSPDELQKNLDAINAEFKGFGVDPRSVDNITDQFKALNTVQGSFRVETERLVAEMKSSGPGMGSPEAFTEALKDRLSEVAIAGGADATAVGSLMDSLPELSGDDVTALSMGRTDVLADGFSEVNGELQKALETMAKIASMTEEVAKLNAQKIEAESAFFAAQKTAIDLQLEGANIQAQYGGKVVKAEKMREAALKKANVGISRSGLSSLQSGSVEEIRRRNQEIRGGVFGIQSRGRANVAAGGGFFGAGPKVTGAGFSSQGQATEAQGKALRQAQQEQISTIKALIAAEEAHLKTIEEKNRLEKESLQSLVDGDVEEFLKKQAAVGATAAIATGDTRLQGIFGAEALGGAFKNLETQQAAGVTDLFGQQIGGAGGLLEQSSQAALSARGVTDPRMAALMAGTTGAEEASKKNIRDLAGELGATGDVGVDIAAQDLQTADFKVQQATIAVQQAMTETQEKSKEAADIRAAGQERANEILERAETQLIQIEENTAALREEQGANSFKVDDTTTKNLLQKQHGEAIAEAKKRNEIAKNVQMMQDSGTNTSARKIETGVLNLIALNKEAVKGTFGKRFETIGKFLQNSVSSAKSGAGTFTQTLKSGGGFKDAFKAGFREFGDKSRLNQGLQKLSEGFQKSKAGGAIRGFAQRSARGFNIGRSIANQTITRSGTGLKATGVAQRFGASFEAIKSTASSLKTLSKTASQRVGLTKLATLSLDKVAKPLFNLGKSVTLGTANVGIGLAQTSAGFLSEKTGRFGLDALKETSIGKSFGIGRQGSDLGEFVLNRSKTGALMAQTRGAEAGVKTGRSATVFNKLGKASNKVEGTFSNIAKKLSGKTGKQLTGEGLEVTGKLLGKASQKFASKLPILGTLVSAGFGAAEASNMGEDTLGIVGGGVLGALTGSAYGGDSLLSSMVGAERGGALDKGLGVVGAGMHGAMSGAAIGTMFGGPIGTAVGAAIGGAAGMITEGVKIAMMAPEVQGAQEVEQNLLKESGKTSETLGLKMAESGAVLSNSIESSVSGFDENARRRNEILAGADVMASSTIAPPSVQAAGGPAVIGAADQQLGVTATGSVAGPDQVGLMELMNVFSQNVTNFGVEMKRFNDGLANNINELKNLKFKIKLDGPTNVNVNFQNAGFLTQLTEGLKDELLKIVAQELVPQIKHNNGGDHVIKTGF